MKYIGTILLCFIITSGVNAQTLRLGPEIGGNLIYMSRDDISREYNLGYHGGINAEFSFLNYLSVRSGVYFTQQKTGYTTSDTSKLMIFGFDPSEFGLTGFNFDVYENQRGVISQYYINIPLMVSYDYKGLSVYAGGYCGFLIGSKTKYITVTDVPFTTAVYVDSLDESGQIAPFLPQGHTEVFSQTKSREGLNNFDYGLKGGIRLRSEFNLGINFNYIHGLADYRILPEGDPKPFRYYQLTMNYNFEYRFGRKSHNSSID